MLVLLCAGFAPLHATADADDQLVVYQAPVEMPFPHGYRVATSEGKTLKTVPGPALANIQAEASNLPFAQGMAYISDWSLGRMRAGEKPNWILPLPGPRPQQPNAVALLPGLRVYPGNRDAYFAEGYDVYSDDGALVKSVNGPTSVALRAEISGKSFSKDLAFLSDWSFERIQHGESPTWICARESNVVPPNTFRPSESGAVATATVDKRVDALAIAALQESPTPSEAVSMAEASSRRPEELEPPLPSSLAVALPKHALLVANADYEHCGKLPNPVLDARQLASVLRTLGFHVELVENAGREEMLNAISRFEEQLKLSRGIAFFHYGGHGVQVDGKNFLIPADADIPDERRVATRAVEVDEVMQALNASGSSASIVVLDACRDNPLAITSSRSAARGLCAVGNKPKNSVIIYAAEAGKRAKDGLFTPSLCKALAVPGRSISEVMTEVRRDVYERSGGEQTPGEYVQLFEQVYLGQRKAIRDGAGQQPPSHDGQQHVPTFQN